MADMQEFSEIEAQLHMVFDRLSNGESVDIKDEWIEQAGEAFKAALRRQTTPRDAFRLRMSNIGKPSCQLQREKSDSQPTRMPYNHIIRMLIGDAVESVVDLGLKAAGVNVTGGKNTVTLDVNGIPIRGENDVEINNKVYDIKSCSPYAFQHKWQDGWNGVYYKDTFGYVEQLYGYSTGQGKQMGGWIVVDKSSGEIKVVEARPTQQQLSDTKAKISSTVSKIANNLPFEKCFTEEEEFFRKQSTGNMIVPKVCTFCQYMSTCWPDAVLKPKAMSAAKEPTPVWYTKYNESTSE